MADRKTTAERGYGAGHQALRADWEPKVRAGGVKCARCNKLISADADWHLDHNKDRTGYLGPSHAHCNWSEGGKAGAAVTNSRWTMTVRDWD